MRIPLYQHSWLEISELRPGDFLIRTKVTRFPLMREFGRPIQPVERIEQNSKQTIRAMTLQAGAFDPDTAKK